jgi:peptidoglycan/LPS O-acetylase OafA/YrhL
MSQLEASESLASSRIFHIPSLDGIRAIAILIVFLSHAGLGRIIPGGMGVTIFFFLSGYLITTLLRREFEKNRSINLKNFYMRRALRIWPNFYFVLCIGAVFTIFGLIPGAIKINPFLGQVFHFTNYYSIFYGLEGTTIGSGVFWSLAVEEHFYLLFPFIYLMLAKFNLSSRDKFLALLLLSCALLVWRYVLVDSIGVSSYRTYYASDTRFDSLLFGCMLAIYGNPILDAQQCTEKQIKYIYVPAAIMLLLFTVVYRSELFRETLRYSLQGIALFPLFIVAIRFPDWGVIRFLNYKIVQFAGVLSYSFYLVHHTVIEVVIFYAHAFPKLYIGLASLIISAVLSYGLYLTVEVPCGKLRHKFA